MRYFDRFNPIGIIIFFAGAIGIPMFSGNPIINIISLCGALLLFFTLDMQRRRQTVIFYLILLPVLTLINPVFSHNGVTVLFVMNNNPVTLEAILYGLSTAVMIISVLCWFRSLGEILTCDRVLYLFGKISPKLSLVLSMSLRYIPLFIRQAGKIKNARKAMGLYKFDNIPDRIRSDLRIFDILITWALENGIITAKSMESRGYGGRRTFHSVYGFKCMDLIACISILALAGVTVAAGAKGLLDFTFYPEISAGNAGVFGILAYVAYSMIVLMPTVFCLEERIRWNLSESKI